MELESSVGPRNLDLLVLIQKEAAQGKKARQGKAHYLEASFIFSLLDHFVLFFNIINIAESVLTCVYKDFKK
jgi:hypothetical protein